VRNYRKISEYFAEQFEGKVRKIAVNASLGCPGRCTYCNNAAFNPRYACESRESITEQIAKGIEFNKNKGDAWGYLVYFQSFSNTFGDTQKLIELYEEALAYPGVKGLVIATRPDCIKEDLRDYFQNRFGAGKPFLLLEIGVESTKNETLKSINRGHDWECAKECIEDLGRRGLNVGAHLIIGLPGETHEDFLEHARKLSKLPVKTLKLHQLQIIKNTPMALDWQQSKFHLLSPEEYAGIISDFLDILDPGIALDRFVSEAPKDMVLAPSWGLKPLEFEIILNKDRKFL